MNHLLARQQLAAAICNDPRWAILVARDPCADDQFFYSVRTTGVTAACRSLGQAESPLPFAILAANAGISPYHFHRLFKTITGLTPRAYATAHRTQRVRSNCVMLIPSPQPFAKPVITPVAGFTKHRTRS